MLVQNMITRQAIERLLMVLNSELCESEARKVVSSFVPSGSWDELVDRDEFTDMVDYYSGIAEEIFGQVGFYEDCQVKIDHVNNTVKVMDKAELTGLDWGCLVKFSHVCYGVDFNGVMLRIISDTGMYSTINPHRRGERDQLCRYISPEHHAEGYYMVSDVFSSLEEAQNALVDCMSRYDELVVKHNNIFG